jgi:pimeloyl-ACP methyl ester carboxylesterase
MKAKFILSLFILMFYSGTLQSQNLPESKELSILTEDGLTISASYQYPANPSKLTPVIILIHQGGSSRIEWLELSSLWDELLEEGYALLAYDVRLHGKSSKDEGDLMDLFNNPNRAPLDLIAVIKFLEKDKHIDPDRIGIIGASIGANLAVMAASMEKYPVKSAVSLSAKTSAVQNLSGMKTPVIPHNVFYLASKNEQNGLREKWAYELYDRTTGKREIEIAKGDKHGSYILRESKFLENSIIEWFKLTL